MKKNVKEERQKGRARNEQRKIPKEEKYKGRKKQTEFALT
jgi:hypothetical protein